MFESIVNFFCPPTPALVPVRNVSMPEIEALVTKYGWFPDTFRTREQRVAYLDWTFNGMAYPEYGFVRL